MNNKVEYYYNRFLYHLKINNTDRFFNFDTIAEKFKNEIREIINNNYDYLLTESFINFLTFECGFLFEDLKHLSDQDNTKRFNIVFYYFEKIDSDYNRNRDGKNNYKEFVNYLTDKEKLFTLKAFETINKVYSKIHDEEDAWLIRCAIIALLTDCFINNDLSIFNDLCDIVVDDMNYILDDNKVNFNKLEDDNAIFNRMISIVKNRYNSMKRKF